MNITREEYLNVVDLDKLSKAKHYLQIYKRTKSKRIKRKNLKKAKPLIFNELDKAVEYGIKKQFDNFATFVPPLESCKYFKVQ